MRPQALLLDMDGVLIDSETASIAALVAVVGHHGIAVSSSSIDETFRGRNLDHCPEAVADLFPGPVPECFVAEVRAHARSLGPAGAVPGAASILTCGLPFRVVTNSPTAHALASLAVAGLGDLVDPAWVLGVDVVGRAKPDPALHRAGLERLGAAPDVCLAIEDSLPGLRAASGAGVRAVGFAATPVHARALAGAGWRTTTDLQALASELSASSDKDVTSHA